MTRKPQTYLERKAKRNWRNSLRYSYILPCKLRLELEIINLAGRGENLDDLIEWYDKSKENSNQTIPFTSTELPIYPIPIVAKGEVAKMIILPGGFRKNSPFPRLFHLPSCYSEFEVFGYHPSSDNGGYCRSQLSFKEYDVLLGLKSQVSTNERG